MKNEPKNQLFDRRNFLKVAGISAGAGMLGVHRLYGNTQKPAIQGFDDTGSETTAQKICNYSGTLYLINH